MNLSKALRNQLFDCVEYRYFLRLVIAENSGQWGFKKRLAEAAGCQPAYLSQVVNGRTEFTPDQAEGLSLGWNLSDLESEYFFNLVLLERAATQALKRRILGKMQSIRELWLSENSSGGAPSISEYERTTTYYSSWLHSAIHLLLTIPNLRSPSALAKHLQRRTGEILVLLEELQKIGIVEKKEGAMASGDVKTPRG